jgi:hypothetical protein
MKFSDAAAEVVRLANARRAFWESELPKHHPDYPLVRPSERRAPPPPEDARLRSLLATLPEEVVYKLILTMYLGRGDFGTTGLDHEYAELKKTFPQARIAASQMGGKVPLGDYLRDGLAKLERAGVDLDADSLEPCGA